MSSRSQICPYCQGLNGADQKRCYRCGRPLPGSLGNALRGGLRGALGIDMPVTRLFTGLALLVLACCIADDRSLPLFSGGFRPSTMLRFGALAVSFGRAEPWRYMAAVFVHANILHILFNMMSLVYLGRAAEREFGSARFAVLYLVTGVFGFVVSDQWYGVNGPLTAGASGAIFGLLGAVIGAAFARRDPGWKDALIQNLVYAAILAFLFRVNTAAHLGGFVSGALFGILFRKWGRSDRFTAVWAVIAVLGVLSVPASLWLSNASPIWRVQRELETRDS